MTSGGTTVNNGMLYPKGRRHNSVNDFMIIFFEMKTHNLNTDNEFIQNTCEI